MTETPPAKKQSPLALIIALALAALLLFLAFRGANWAEMLATVQSGRFEWLLFAFAAMSGSYFLRALRWRVLLSAQKWVNPITVYWGTCAGYLGNSFLPARAGEVIRAVLIARKTGISTSYVFATALTERVMDVGALVLFSLYALPLAGADLPAWVLSAVQVMGVFGALGIGFFLLAPRLRQPIAAFVGRLPLRPSLRQSLLEIIDKFLQGMAAFQDLRRAVGFLALTLLLWAGDVVVGLAVANAFAIALSPAQTILLLAALGLSSAAPSTPGYVGIYQFVAVTVLGPFGVGQNQALVYIIAFQAVTYAVTIIWGGLGLYRLGVGAHGARE
jgi:glycosyltransferase 2 family protein